ncbi:ribosomal protein L1p/L10e family-domain-containing protein [Fimicolochytrium jonesii]|uniref:ribosomal protein L1p/L10e family-domain-containing protein n=1 Tax=Fimicolochytrium jonesii TaxID=1396493 RepID=UPI0022FF0C40|nr:ribosomal protein L1p/L10e family-domain-containing protein [Fimicolochytrium jonesii]KAI8817656.1 ribosomal protein L1p/L10e family-domain-containing protein [Fimicolochytrium jonesii]
MEFTVLSLNGTTQASHGTMAVNIDEAQVTSAVKALFAYHAKRLTEKAESALLDDENVSRFDLIVTTKAMPSKRRDVPLRILLPNGLYKDAEVCLITKDPQGDFKKLLLEKNVQGISKVLGFSKLRSKFKPYEAKRQLASSYSLFLADERILPLLPQALGKTFFAKKQIPAPVNMTKVDLAREIQKALQSTYLRRNNGVTNTIRVATTDFTPEQVIQNIMAAIPSAIEKLPKKWANIHSIHIKTSNSMALPLYQTLPDAPEGYVEAVETGASEEDAMEVTETIETSKVVTKTPTKGAKGKEGTAVAVSVERKTLSVRKERVVATPPAATPSKAKALLAAGKTPKSAAKTKATPKKGKSPAK